MSKLNSTMWKVKIQNWRMKLWCWNHNLTYLIMFKSNFEPKCLTLKRKLTKLNTESFWQILQKRWCKEKFNNFVINCSKQINLSNSSNRWWCLVHQVPQEDKGKSHQVFMHLQVVLGKAMILWMKGVMMNETKVFSIVMKASPENQLSRIFRRSLNLLSKTIWTKIITQHQEDRGQVKSKLHVVEWERVVHRGR